MARARNIKPGLYKNEDLAECSIWARYIFPGLWMQADRDGRLEDRPKRLKGELLPYDSVEIEPLLAELHTRRFILRYQNEEGYFIQILTFGEHQTPHYSEKPSVIKPPTNQEITAHQLRVNPGGIRESLRDESSTVPRTLPEHSRNHPAMKGGAQPPDSLIPDSKTSHSKQRGSGNTSARANPAAAALLALLRRERVEVKRKDELLVDQWVAEGVTEVEVEAAIRIARSPERKPEPQTLWASYLAPIVVDVRAGRAAPQQPQGKEAIAIAMANIAAKERAAGEEGRWWETLEGVQQQAMELGLEIGPGEDWPEFKARVIAANGSGEWFDAQPPDMRERVEHYRAFGWQQAA